MSSQPQSTKDSPRSTSAGGGRIEGGGFCIWVTCGGISYTGRRGASSLLVFRSWSSVIDLFDNHSDNFFSGSLSCWSADFLSLAFCFSFANFSSSAFLSVVKCENLQFSIKLHTPVLRKFLHGLFESSSWSIISGFLQFFTKCIFSFIKNAKFSYENTCEWLYQIHNT